MQFKLIFALVFFTFSVYARENAFPLVFEKKPFKGADCNETPVTVEQFTNLASSPNVKNINDLLKALPEGSFESYTYITNSLSAQKGSGESGVSAMWPRVIRSNQDGSITFTWTCNPNSGTYNEVEMLYVKDNELLAKSFKLDKPPDSVGIGGRINHAPTSCTGCHSTGVPIQGKLSMKHNWPEYFAWSDCKDNRGIQMYGGNDDNMGPESYRGDRGDYPEGCGNAEVDKKQVQTEQANFQKFKEMQKDNPCYNLLPSPKNQEKVNGADYSYYPYANRSRDTNDEGRFDYSLRTNLRFTDVYAHHNANRITAILQKSPNYEKIKYFLALDAAQCLTENDNETISRLVPGLQFRKLKDPWRKYADPRDHSLIYDFAKMEGIQPADWSLEYKSDPNHDNPVYFPGIANVRGGGGDLGIANIVGGNILKNVGEKDSIVATASKNVFADGIARTFGERFSCIDDLGKAIKGQRLGSMDRDLCRALRPQAEKAAAEYLNKKDECTTHPATTREQANDVLSVVDKMREEIKKNDSAEFKNSVERGKELVQNPQGAAHCVNCHGRSEKNIKESPRRFLFIPSDSVSTQERKISLDTLKNAVNGGFFKELEDSVHGQSMPQDGVLNAEQRKDVVNYLKSLVVE